MRRIFLALAVALAYAPLGAQSFLPNTQAQQAELDQLLRIDRPELVKVVSWAASNGDRSENGDYIYGKRRLREMDRRIRFLIKRLESATRRTASGRTLFSAASGAQQ